MHTITDGHSGTTRQAVSTPVRAHAYPPASTTAPAPPTTRPFSASPFPAVCAPARPSDLAIAVADALAHGPSDPFAFEHTLAALVHAARTDRRALRAALVDVAEKAENLVPQPHHDFPSATPLRQLHALVLRLAWLPGRHPAATADRAHVRHLELSTLVARLDLPLDRPPGMDVYALRSPADILTLRLSELSARIAAPSLVELVSTPTDPSGRIEPEDLLARIAEAEQAGWQPWPLDLDQALLRLPEAGPATVRAAQRLASPAGRRLAGWLRGGRPALPTPRCILDRPDADRLRAYARNAPTAPRFPLPAEDPDDLPGPAVPTTLIHLLRRGWFPPVPLADGSCWPVCWPALLPNHPDLVAVAAAWHSCHRITPLDHAHANTCQPTVLTALTANQLSPIAPATPELLAAVARALTSRSPAKRLDAADALAALATEGRLDAGRLSRALTQYAIRPDRQYLRSAVPALRRALAQTPADAANSTITAAILSWLPALLPPTVPQPPPYASHLLSLVADATEAGADSLPVPPNAVINTLITLAARPSRSPVSDAAQRLLIALGVHPS